MRTKCLLLAAKQTLAATVRSMLIYEKPGLVASPVFREIDNESPACNLFG